MNPAATQWKLRSLLAGARFLRPLLLRCDTRFLRFLCENTPALMKIAVITVSDTVSRGERADASGPAVVARCKELGWPVASTHLVADDAFQIETMLKRLADEEKMDLIL